MDDVIRPTPKVFATPFSALTRWDPNSFHRIKWYWPSSVMAPIGSVLTSRKEKVDRGTVPFAVLMPITIHFDGSIEPRKGTKDKAYTMELFRARPGDVVVSKIDLKNGAAAIIPDDWDNAVVTNHFAVYEPNLDRLNPRYFHILVQTPFLKMHLWRNKVGAEGRKEVKLRFFEALEIPIPPPPVQQKIVEHWEAAQRDRLSAESSLSALVAELNAYLVTKTNAFDQATQSRTFLTAFKNTQQWDVKGGRAAAFVTANPDFVRLGEYTDECTDTVKPWEQPDKEWPIFGVNNKEGVFLSSTQEGKDFNAAYKIIEKGWFFHNPTRANVGSLGIVPEIPSSAITSPEYQVWRLKGGFLPDFMALMLRTDYFLALVALNRVGGVKQRMYYTNLTALRLPTIPEVVQRDFARRRLQILQNIDCANKMVANRRNEIEQMILGTLSPMVH